MEDGRSKPWRQLAVGVRAERWKYRLAKERAQSEQDPALRS